MNFGLRAMAAASNRKLFLGMCWRSPSVAGLPDGGSPPDFRLRILAIKLQPLRTFLIRVFGPSGMGFDDGELKPSLGDSGRNARGGAKFHVESSRPDVRAQPPNVRLLPLHQHPR